MEKVYVALIMLVMACIINENAAGYTGRSAKMSNMWLGDNRGSGSFASRGTAGGHWNSRENNVTKPSRPERPTAADCYAEGFYPTPGSCTHFYRCVDWTGDASFFSIFHFNCPVGTVFDDNLDICNHGSAAGRPECSEGGGSGSEGGLGGGEEGKEGDDDPDSDEEEDEEDDDGVFSLTCHADNVYRRHPLYCNKYYYCIFDGQVWSVPSFICPQGLVFDEENQNCARDNVWIRDDCKLAPYEEPNTNITGEDTTLATVTDSPIDITTQKVWQVDPNSLYDCPAPGYYPYEGDCIRFYKCVETEEQKLKGLLYRCPENYGYSEERLRCHKEADLPPCQRVPHWSHTRVENATPLYPQDLIWFFNN